MATSGPCPRSLSVETSSRDKVLWLKAALKPSACSAYSLTSRERERESNIILNKILYKYKCYIGVIVVYVYVGKLSAILAYQN